MSRPAASTLGAGELDAHLDRARALVREEIVPLEPLLLEERFDELEPALERLRDRVRAAGLWAPFLPAEFGGMGLSLADFARFAEVLGYSPLAHFAFNCQAPDAGNLELLAAHGSPDQRERWLGPLARGTIRSCFAMTEPEHAGSNPLRLSTIAQRDGDDYVIDGHKWFASSADGAAVAVVMAVTDPEGSEPYRRASLILVPTDTPGFVRVRNLPVMGDEGRGWFSHAELRFTDCRVPVANRIGAEGAAFALAQERLGPGRIHHAMRWVGLAERALHELCSRAASRELAPGRPLASRQAIQHWIGESRAEIDAARLLVLDTAPTIDREGQRAARVQVSAIKFFVAGVLDRVVDRALQTHGALGMTDLTILSYIYRHERAARIYDGADEVHKSVVAREILKGYGVTIEI